MSDPDEIDEGVGQWRAERPERDLRAMATVARPLHLGRLLRRELGALAAKYDVLVPEADILFTLRRWGPPYRLLPPKLSDSLLVSSGTLASRLDRLEANGLVERHPNPEDRRSVEVALTRRGRELADESLTADVANERRMLSALSEREVETLHRQTSKLLVHLSPAK